MKRMLKSILCFMLLLSLFATGTFSAFAQEESGTEQMSILDDEALNAAVESLLASWYVEGERLNNISFAYTYLATGDTWYYNPDVWYYPGSVYKVPMMMLMAEKEASGELTRDSDLGGYTLGEAEELILVWSNNDYAHMIRKYLGGDEVARRQYQKYSPLDESYYHSDFVDYCFFTVRYMDSVMQHLYNNSENFPNIIDSLLVAMPNNFYHLKIDPSVPIAQKYGAFQQYNANTGIIYTPNPFILTFMSDCLSYDKAEHIMGDAAKLFMDYTLSLDSKLAAYEQEKAAAEAAAAEAAAAEAEAERLRLEEEERIAREKAEEEARIEAERLAEEQRLREEAEAKARREKIALIAAVVLACLAVLGGIVLAVLRSVRKKRRERELARRRELVRQRRYGLDEEESHASFVSQSRGGRDSYRPRH